MAKLAQAQEPSMEEILASIRRIISDEETVGRTPAPAEDTRLFADEGGEAEHEEEGVLELSHRAVADAVLEERRPPAPPRPLFADALRPSLRAEPAAPAPAAATPPEAAAAPPPAGDRSLLSPGPDAAVTSAFNNLASTILSSQARTLEDLVKDMLRPMLRSWLDDNLPPLVERLVREEIERVARGRR